MQGQTKLFFTDHFHSARLGLKTTTWTQTNFRWSKTARKINPEPRNTKPLGFRHGSSEFQLRKGAIEVGRPTRREYLETSSRYSNYQPAAHKDSRCRIRRWANRQDKMRRRTCPVRIVPLKIRLFVNVCGGVKMVTLLIVSAVPALKVPNQ